MTPGFRYEEGRRRQTICLAADIQLDERTKVGRARSDLTYANSMGWALGSNQERWQAIMERVGSDKTAEFFEKLLQETIGEKTIALKHIISGIDGMTLYAYQDFGYTTGAE